jgi:glyoxylase-like metal-dependent hydrolase (beta-lactamase superfamily II)
MEIYPIISTTADSNVYLIKDEKTTLIDTGTGMDDCVESQIKKILDGHELDYIINTHAHYDHAAGNRRFEAEVMIHRDDAKELLSGTLYGTYKFFGDEVPQNFDRLIEGGDKIELGDSVLEVIHTPGHTMGSISLFLEDDKILFTGDTLFTNGGFGRTDLGGDEKILLQTLEALQDVNFELLYPGHEVIVEDGKHHLAMALEIFRGF